MSAADPRNLLDDLIARARRAGADAADALMVEAASLSLARRLGKPEKLERAESQDLGLRVLIGKRQALVSSSDRAPAILDALVERAVAMARSVPEDPYCGLASPDEIERHPPVLDPRVSGGLVGHLAGAINGGAITRGTSFLKDSLGRQVMARGLTVTDDPHRARGMRSRPFDGEGIAGKKRDIVADGVLTTWILDLRSARQLGHSSTGHASRGTSSPPSPGTTNLFLAPGTITRDALIGGIDQGFYVTELIGFGVNGITGDYSRGAAGFWIEGGALAYPVSEVTIEIGRAHV